MIINSAKLWDQLRGRTAYEIDVLNGYKGTEQEWLRHITAYGIAVSNGYEGPEDEWLLTLKGPLGGDTTIFTLEEMTINKIWIDKKPMYRKVIEVGALTNTSTKIIPHNISNIGTVITFYAICIYPDGKFATFMKTAANLGRTETNLIDLMIDSTNISIYSSQNNTDKLAYVIIEYTKSVDPPLTDIEIELMERQKGKQGYSAYEIAVKNGFIGTESEWLDSLRKPSLPPGGIDGEFLIKNSNDPENASWQSLNIDFRSYRHEQTASSNKWIIEHNFDSSEFIFDAKTDNNESILCDIDILETTSNTLVLNLTKPTAGYCVVYAKTNKYLPVPTRNIVIDSFSQKIKNHGQVFGTLSVNVVEASIHSLIATNNLKIGFTGWPKNKSSSVILSVKIPGDINPLITFENNIKWDSEIQLNFMKNTEYRIQFISDNEGQTILAILIGCFK